MPNQWMKYSLCDDWEFTPQWTDEFATGQGKGESVRLPHTCQELPLHYIDPDSYQMVCGYRRTLHVPESLKDQRVFLQFDGAAHISDIYVNGVHVTTHRCGYTACRVEITDRLRSGDNLVAVRLDTTENSQIPPFGFVIDYLTYGGLYREVWCDVRGPACITDIYVTTPSLKTATIQVTTDGAPEGSHVLVAIEDSDGNEIWTGDPGEAHVADAQAWSPEHPHLYRLVARLVTEDGQELDRQETTFGFRTVEFKADGFYLNGRKTFLRGLNRHQSYPYVGYAVPAALQKEDARILKRELGCNAVRTSHYPQSHHFLDECDRLGLLVFTEIPGWQHIGDEPWKDQACENTAQMVLQYRNHPSIILWGVRINESIDDDAFYTRTNAIAHELDPSRPTSGVRYIERSHLLEDVYAYNDFSHSGSNPGVKPKKSVTSDMDRALLISECNGHMFPAKPYDSWAKRQEHALRHVRVQNDALREHAGCLGWCMFDYPTHKDFGSGDRICYHGVLDAFRNPKLAASVYASQDDEEPVLVVGSNMDSGDYPADSLGTIYVFSNADEVALYRNGKFVTNLAHGEWDKLAHPPFVVDDTIGKLLESEEGFDPQKAKVLRDCLLEAARCGGVAGLPTSTKMKMLWCMVRYGMTFDDGLDLYGKYITGWGDEATTWRFDAIRGGQTVKSVVCRPSSHLHLEARASHTHLHEADTYDMAAIRIRILDENGNPAPYAQIPVSFTIRGDAEIVGPRTVTAEGGMCGTYVRTMGKPGSAELTIHSDQTQDTIIHFTISSQETTRWN